MGKFNNSTKQFEGSSWTRPIPSKTPKGGWKGSVPENVIETIVEELNDTEKYFNAHIVLLQEIKSLLTQIEVNTRAPV